VPDDDAAFKIRVSDDDTAFKIRVSDDDATFRYITMQTRCPSQKFLGKKRNFLSKGPQSGTIVPVKQVK
jgi:hypothetical protein